MGATATFQNAQNLLIAGRHAESVKAFSDAIDAGENNAITYLSRGVARLQLGDLEQAEEDFTRSLQLNPSTPRAWYYRGTARMVARNFVEAIRDFTRTIALEPRHGLAYLARGTCYEETGMREAAAKDIRAALMETRASTQRFVDSMGMIRTQADRAFHLTIGEARHPELSETEWQQLKRLIENDAADS